MLWTWSILISGALAADPVFDGDVDGDGVPDADDLCPWDDDTVDLDANGHPDCDETLATSWGANAWGSESAWLGRYDAMHSSAQSFTPVWKDEDANGYVHSGSVISWATSPVWVTLTTAQCFPVDASTDYVIGLRYLPLGNGDFTSTFRVIEYPGTSCSGTTTVHPIQVVYQDNWCVSLDFRSDVTTYTPPSGVRSVRLEVKTEDTHTNYPFAFVQVDDPLFYPLPPVVDQWDGLDGGPEVP
ncbi:MAG: hypothetical protein KC621_31805 [Myxococcales bacterium]|nr:hypothetical protein [Myxococcales bacterium]